MDLVLPKPLNYEIIEVLCIIIQAPKTQGSNDEASLKYQQEKETSSKSLKRFIFEFKPT